MSKLKILLFNIILIPLKITKWAAVNKMYTMVSKSKDSRFYDETSIFNLSSNRDNIVIKNNSHIRGELLVFKSGGKIEIGNNTFIGSGSKIWSGESIKIGNNVLISHNVNIIDSNSHEINYIERQEGFINLIKHGHPLTKGSVITKPIVIEDNVWINFNAIILKGVKIGKGSIISAGAIVTKDVPAFSLILGDASIQIRDIK